MDKRKLFFGLAIVFAVTGVVLTQSPDAFFGRGSFYDHNFGLIHSLGVGSLVVAGIFGAFAYAVKS